MMAMPSREEFDEAFHHAQAIYGFVLQHLPKKSLLCRTAAIR
jgi:hypothetical protein